MSWVYKIDPDARKALLRFPSKDAVRITKTIEAMRSNPYLGDLQKLGGDAWRRRIGSYRIKFELHTDEKVIYIYEIYRRNTTTYRH
jgi:mRNA-degrading endonuclease RelE of RelBE toxin-antitoxin system